MSDPSENPGATPASAGDVEIRITPEPDAADRDAILAAVKETLRHEAELARPSPWRLQGWVGQRVGLTDLANSIPDGRRWALSSRMPLGGRTFSGLNGRGDAK